MFKFSLVAINNDIFTKLKIYYYISLSLRLSPYNNILLS